MSTTSSSTGSGTGTSKRQLKRAEEGLRLFQDIVEAREQAVKIMLRGDGLGAIAGSHHNARGVRVAESALAELEEAVSMMRGGMPNNAFDMGKALAYWGRCLHEWGHNRRVLPVLAEAIDLLKSHPTPTEYGWGSSLLNAASIVGHEM